MTKHLYRSTEHRLLAGVCGGRAQYFDIDPTIALIILIILMLPGGLPGVLPYAILWAIILQNPVSRVK